MCVCVIQYRLKREFGFSQKEKVKRMSQFVWSFRLRSTLLRVVLLPVPISRSYAIVSIAKLCAQIVK